MSQIIHGGGGHYYIGEGGSGYYYVRFIELYNIVNTASSVRNGNAVILSLGLGVGPEFGVGVELVVGLGEIATQ